jgi:hypothetical protein
MAAFRASCFALCAAKKMLRDWVSQGAPPLHPVVHAVHSPPLLIFLVVYTVKYRYRGSGADGSSGQMIMNLII